MTDDNVNIAYATYRVNAILYYEHLLTEHREQKNTATAVLGVE